MRKFTFLLLGCLLAAAGAVAQGTTIYYVNRATGSDAASGIGSWNNAFKTLQQALSVVGPNSQVWVATGTYYPDEGGGKTANDRNASFELKNGVALYGGFAGGETALSQRNWETNVTTLSGDVQQNDFIFNGQNFEPVSKEDNSIHVVVSNGVAGSSVLDGFRIVGGYPNQPNLGLSDKGGGGMLNFNHSSPTVSNCTFTGNSANQGFGYGNGMLNVDGSAPVVSDCTFSANGFQSTRTAGSGMANIGSSPTLINCRFTDNFTEYVGCGMYNSNASPTLTNCSFTGNETINNGGGMFNTDNSSPSLLNCSFVGNISSSGFGGGVCNQSSSPTFTNCLFLGNYAGSASGIGGGGMANLASSPQLQNCTFSGNRSVAVLTTDGAMLNVSGSSPTLTNCILWGNAGGEIGNDVMFGGNNNATVSYSIVQGGYAGIGNSSQNPLFVLPPNGNNAPATTGNLRLQCGSPAIDAGNDAANAEATDLDGNTRKLDAITGGRKIDMGAFEYQQAIPTWYQDTDGDGHAVAVLQSCTQPAGTGWSTAAKPADDCKDDDNTVYPGAPELCDGKDNNCNNQVDEGGGQTYYRDADGDGFGDATVFITSCSPTPPAGYVHNNWDSNDTDGKTKIFVCHSGKTLVVSAAALQAHLDHGDYGGQCGTPVTTMRTMVATETKLTVPEKFTLTGSPNPFVNTTRITYSIPVSARVSITIYDVTGREVGSVFSGDRAAGWYSTDYSSARLSSGIYYAKMTATASGQTFVQTQKLVKAH